METRHKRDAVRGPGLLVWLGVLLPAGYRVSSACRRVCGSHLGGPGAETLLGEGKYLNPLQQLPMFSAEPTLKGTLELSDLGNSKDRTGTGTRALLTQLAMWDSSTKWAL